MFKITHLDPRQARVLNPLVLDYIERKPALAAYYDFYPDKAGFAELLKTKPYADFNRVQLVDILQRQSRLVNNTTEATQQQIQSLKENTTFTVTTGHQLCLFTGPLYFIYKIFSTINLARDLEKQFPGNTFVPVYWMASEDHDFEEVASFAASPEKTITWHSEQKGAVGNFKTRELKALLPELSAALGLSENSKYLVDLFESAYVKHDTLAQATRYLVNALFGGHGLVCVDGDDAAFKQQFKNYFKKDIFENRPHDLVNTSIHQLEQLGYSIQVKPRPINCFYLDDQLRARIEKNGDTFNLVGTNRSFTAQELEKIIEEQPERISPNVVLRPLYQQVILPNLSYTGGPGELAYWLEFKSMFRELGVFLPVLMPRNFISVVDLPTKHTLQKLNFSETDFFKPEQELIKDYLVSANAVFELNAEARQLSEIYKKITDRAKAVDVTLERHVLAAQKRAMNQLDMVSAKTNRALKRKSETQLRQIEQVKERLFPNGVPQERHDNFAAFYLKYGPAFFKAIEAAIDPFLLDQKVLVEE